MKNYTENSARNCSNKIIEERKYCVITSYSGDKTLSDWNAERAVKEAFKELRINGMIFK